MADEKTVSEKKESKENFIIQRIYVKDISFESPHAPAVFQQEWKPEVNMDLSSNAQELDKGLYNVVLKTTVSVKQDKKDVFLVEVQQAGIFTISGFNAEQQDHLLGSFAPSVLFPYIRQVISELAIQGGFPPLYLAPINFDAYYAEKKKREAEGVDQQQAQAANESEAASDKVH